MKVLIAFLTTESDDPNMEAEFINGYELNGGTWTGTVDILENITANMIDADWLQDKVDNGYSAVIRNTGNQPNPSNQDLIYTDALNQGLAYITAVGSNEYSKNIPQLENYNAVIRCGSGERGSGNSTSYPCMFYDQAVESEPVNDLTGIFRCGDTYNISQIYRLTATRLAMSFENVTDVRTIGFFDWSVPLTINSLSGSDISPLPSGNFYVADFGTNYSGIVITVPATTGTAGLQNVTGQITYGADTMDVFIAGVEDYQPLIATGNAVTLNGISGFQNNPEGTYQIYQLVDFIGYRNLFKVNYSLGSGTSGGGGTASLPSQSYATPYIAGQLCWLKDRMGSDWYDVLGRAMKTASEYVSGYTYQDGFGYLNVADAVFETDITLDTPVIVADSNTAQSVIIFHWNPIPYAEQYEIYYKGELLDTLEAHVTEYSYSSGTREAKGVRRLWKVRAKRGTTYSEFSNELEQNYYANNGILAYTR